MKSLAIMTASLSALVIGCSAEPDSTETKSLEPSALEAARPEPLDSSAVEEIVGNDAHNMLAKLSGLERAMGLANVVKTLENKKYCSPERTLFRGIGDGKSFWSIQCHDGESYQVMINKDGSGGTVSCSTLELVKAGDCWTKFDDEKPNGPSSKEL